MDCASSRVPRRRWQTWRPWTAAATTGRCPARAFRYTATGAPDRTLDAVLAMLRATSAGELESAMRSWVDPVNNFVFADVHGAIGYRTRGQVPIRPMANAWVPVPGWDGAHEW